MSEKYYIISNRAIEANISSRTEITNHPHRNNGLAYKYAVNFIMINNSVGYILKLVRSVFAEQVLDSFSLDTALVS